MSTSITATATEPANNLIVPSIDGDVNVWDEVLNEQTFPMLLGYILWLYDNVGSGAADGISYDNAASELTAEDVQAAIDEIVAGLGSAAAADVEDFATAAQGALAGSALQPGDALTGLSSGAATAGQIPKADGAGGIAWGDQVDTSTLLAKTATINSYAGNHTLDSNDSGAYVRITAAGEVTLPDSMDEGFQCVIVNATDSDEVSLAAATTLTIPTGFDAKIQNRRAVTVVHVGSNAWEAHGALVESA